MRTPSSTGARVRSERGAILLQVAIASIVLMALSMFVLDFGMLWVSRRQAQNAADSGALAGAVALGFDNFNDRTNTGPAKVAAHQFAISNVVWGQAPDNDITTDVTFPACPDDGTNTCIRVDVYRNQARGNALPSWFAQLVGITTQGVRATAIAQAAAGNASDCIKPFGIPDKWNEIYPTPKTWDANDEFDKTDNHGNPLPNPDVYVPRTVTNGTVNEGTGFTLTADYGTMVVLKANNPHDAIAPGFFFPVQLPLPGGGTSTGGADYEYNIAHCNGVPVKEGDTLSSENGNMIGPTTHGLEDLIALDPGAHWDPTMNGGKGGVAGSCAQSATPCASVSPRIVAVPVFDTQAYYNGKMNGNVVLTVARILGFFVANSSGNEITGYLTSVPGLKVGSGYPSSTPGASFVTTIQLVR